MSHDVEAIALVLNHLVVLGRATGSEELTEIVLGNLASPLAVRVQGYCGFEIAVRRQKRPASEESFGFIFAAPLDFELAGAVASHAGPLEIEFRSRGRPVGEAAMVVLSLPDLPEDAHDAIELLCEAMQEANPTFAHIVASIDAEEYASARILPHLDSHLVAPGIGFVATGWAENLGEQSVVFLLDKFRLAVHPEQVFLNPRPDVLPDVAGRGGRTDLALHGFTLIDAVDGSRHELRLAALGGSSVQWSSALDLTDIGSTRGLLQMLAEKVPPRDVLRRPASASVLRRFLASLTPRQATSGVFDYQTATGTPDVSIVIPFYRDDFFLVDHLESQRRTDANAEWIFVSDDPGLNAPMDRTCQSRRGNMTKATKLVSLSANLGFGRANNVAFREARSDYVAFMNSDIYWRSFAPIAHGLAILRDDPTVGIVGFVLRYEDETIQHAGMRFEAFPDLDDLVLSVHDGKGLPARQYGAAITSRDVKAVTGALMLVRRSDFGDTVFDEAYVGGDFEDGDLCLQMRARGKRIVLVECDGLYHLERQSIGGGDLHRLFTLVNCTRFAAKWKGSKALLEPPTAGRAAAPALASGNRPGSDSPVPATVFGECAVHAHIFYPDLLAEMFSYLNRPHMRPFDTFITVTDPVTRARVVAEIQRAGRPNIFVDELANAGRDLAPLFIHHRGLFARYKYICHVHTKKSPHTNFGDAWRRYLLDACIGSEASIRSVLAHFESRPTTGIAFPVPYAEIAPFTRLEFNTARIDEILRGINAEWSYQSIAYPAGSMCWLRSDAFEGALDRLPPLSRFEQEDNQIDGTLAHALERCLTLIPRLGGYASLCYRPLPDRQPVSVPARANA